MSSIKLTRAQWLRVEELEGQVFCVGEADRLFFEKFPHRKHFVRLAAPAEIDRQAILDGGLPEVPQGHRFFAIVRHVVPGRRLRLLTPAPEGTDTELNEGDACWAFITSATMRVWKIEAETRKAAGLES